MTRIFFNFVIISFLWAGFASARIIKVPQDYPTIQQGIDAAQAGDVVMVAAGNYPEHITLKSKVKVRGAGAGLSVIDGGGDNGDVVKATGNDITNETIFQGFTVTGAISGGSMPGGAGIFCNSAAKPDISNNLVTGNDFGIATWNQSTAYIHNNVVADNNFDGIDLMAKATVINNTIVHNRIGINDGGGYAPTVMNNIVARHWLYGIYAVGASPVLTYNDVWHNATNYQNCTGGTGSISADPLFTDSLSDFHLQVGSPCIDAGNPAAQYNDPDGSRNDMGAYGGPAAPANFPRVELTIPGQNELNTADSTTAQAFFSLAMNSSTMTSDNVIISGNLTGLQSAVLTYDSLAKLIIINPNSDFRAGELVNVVLTKNIEAANGDSLAGFTWQYFTATTSGSALFSAAAHFAVGADPTDIAAGDFNKDGNIDLAVTGYTSNNVAVLLGSGNGTFFPSVFYGVGTNPDGIAVLDLNGDGNQDLAVANRSSGNVSILLGNGTGAFVFSANYNAGSGPCRICGADYNLDGDPDLTVTNQSSNNISFLAGNGDGSFDAAVNYPVGTGPQGITVADFNRDGHLDIASANSAGNNISILLGQGNGTFGTATNYPVGTGPCALTITDCNEDGNIDLIVANYGSDNASRLLGNGDGTFGAASNYAAGDGPSAVSIADFNGDGHHDLALSDANSNNIALLMGNGTGSFGAAVYYPAGTKPSGLVSADFDNDGDQDFSSASNAADSIAVLLNGTALNVAAITPQQNQIAVSGSSDITVTFNIAVDSSTITSSSLVVFGLQSGRHSGTISYTSGTFTARFDPSVDFYAGEMVCVILTKTIRSLTGSYLKGFQWGFTVSAPSATNAYFGNGHSFTIGSQPRALWAADFDHDSDVDLAATSSPNRIGVVLNNGSGAFSSPVYATVESDPISLYGADLDGDGDIDLASAHNQPGSSHLVILKNNGSGSFSVFATYTPATLGQAVYGGDLDADNDIDLVMTDGWGTTNNVRVMKNNGTASFSGPYVYSAGTWARGVHIMDVDNDGDLDLIVVNQGNNNASVLYNDGSGNFPVMVNFAVGSSPNSVCGNDYNGDHDLDLVSANYGADDISIALNAGNGTFGTPTEYTVGPAAEYVDGADLDGDGDIDLAVAPHNINSIAVLLNNGAGSFGNLALYDEGNAPCGIRTADFDGDGDIDIACNNVSASSNNLRVFFNTMGDIQENGQTGSFTDLRIFPNPSIDRVRIEYQLGQNDGLIEITIYDATGQQVRSFDLRDQKRINRILWDGTDNHRQEVASGIYFCRMKTRSRELIRQIIFIK